MLHNVGEITVLHNFMSISFSLIAFLGFISPVSV